MGRPLVKKNRTAKKTKRGSRGGGREKNDDGDNDQQKMKVRYNRRGGPADDLILSPIIVCGWRVALALLRFFLHERRNSARGAPSTIGGVRKEGSTYVRAAVETHKIKTRHTLKKGKEKKKRKKR